VSDLVADLLAAEGLPDSYRDTVDQYWRPLAAAVADRCAARGRPLLVAINGPQGSGKSTLCLFLERLLADAHGLRAATLSLDDLYLPRAERMAVAAQRHPLFATRGPPGTHDVYLGLKVIADVLAGKPASLPRFDKATDDRAPAADWRRLGAGADVLLFEGWCVGALPQPEADLAEPINALERDEDAEGRWRRQVNDQLQAPYRPLFDLHDMLVMLRPPGWEQVGQWRAKQEAKLRARSGRGMDEASIARFVQHYERVTRHALATLPARADVVVAIDADHRVVGLSGPAAPAR